MDHKLLTNALMQTHQEMGTTGAARVPEATYSPSHSLRQLQQQLGNQGLGSFIQAKFKVSQPGEPLEEEADRMADELTRASAETVLDSPGGNISSASPLQRKCLDCAPEGIQRQSPNQSEPFHNGGETLSPTVRAFFEPRFGYDFSSVRIHRDAGAAIQSSAIDALAYTRGRHIFFGENQFAPETVAGRKLLAHELTHTIQQNSPGHQSEPIIQRYTPEERRAMAEGRVVGQANDLQMAAARHFQPGDIVFRSGSTALGIIAGEPVTHGGIYVGGGLIHDAVGFGNRHVRVTNFFSPALNEAADASIYRVVRFRGPQRDLIISRLLQNISQRNFRMPTDPVPFNLFSSAGDYRTATCLEYAHAQFLHAIRQLSLDETVAPAIRQSLRATYFTGNAAEPNALIRPREQRLMGSMPSMDTFGGSGGPQASTSISAPAQEMLLIAAASAMANDVDPTRFSNRSESQYSQHWPGGSGIGGTIVNMILGMSYDEVVLRTFTYSSFVDSRQFFEDVTQ